MNPPSENRPRLDLSGGIVKRTRILLAGLLVTLPFLQHAGAQAPNNDSIQLSKTVPIADVHMHIFKGLTPADLLSAMDRNKVQWGGGVGPVGPGYDPKDFLNTLGSRYFPGGGQAEQYTMFQSGGERALLDANSAEFKALLEKLEQQFTSKEIFGVGELILNNKQSIAMPGFGRKVDIDAEALQQLYRLAEKHKGFVQIHMDGDNDSIEAMEKVAKAYPSISVILAHCMSRATVQTAKGVLERNGNVYCDTSYRSTARNGSPFLRPHMIHTESSADASWIALIEAMPDRFMVGSDIYTKDVAYDTVIAAIRTGLLEKLTVPTLKKVAFENAQRVFHLPEVSP